MTELRECLMERVIRLDHHQILKPTPASDMTRLGNLKDGGYVVSVSSIESAQILVSFGLGTNITFERDALIKNPNLDVKIFDHTVSKPTAFGLFRLLVASFLNRNTSLFKDGFSLLQTYKNKRIHHFRKRIVAQEKNYGEMSVSKVFQDIVSKPVFLKVDIEGDEFQILSDILKVRKKLTGLVIEFHDSEKNYDEIIRFVQILATDMRLVHFHGNNFSSINSLGLPEVFELSFISSKDFRESNKELKLPLTFLDARNAPKREDFEYEI